jgi:GNAT superfamily N-acetyltransferase
MSAPETGGPADAGGVRIVAATEADLPALLALHAQAGDGRVLPLEHALEIFRRMSEYPSYVIYVARRGEDVVGTFSLIIMENLGHVGASSALVENVLVDERCRSEGIGTAMMHFAMEQARRAGCYKLALSSNLVRERAHAFYDRLGFERHGYSFRVLL